MRWTILVCAVLAVCPANDVRAINIVLDYSYDTTNFFGAGNPSGSAAGAQARVSLEAAAAYLSGILTDTFEAIQTPAPLYSSVSNGVYTWTWSLSFTNPSGTNTVSLTNPSIAADEFRVYAGARGLGGNTLGVGGPGGWSYSASSNGGNFSAPEIGQIEATNAAFGAAVSNRGEPAGDFGKWGGAITFDRDGSTNWHYDSTSSTVPNNKNDFYSVALHELTHTVGFGISNAMDPTEWDMLVSGGRFMGPKAWAANGGAYPTVSGGHWTSGTTSTVYGTSISQEAAMDPEINNGTRKRFSTLDAAGLDDIGWSLQSPALIGDFNGDGYVDAADYTVWRDTLGRTGAGLAADASGNNVVDGVDYMLWKNHFGDSLGIGLGIPALGVPEPPAALLAAFTLLAALRRPTRHTKAQ